MTGIINLIDEYLEVQKSSADMRDPYMRGMYNGIEFVRAMITKDEPVFMEKMAP